MVAVGGAGQPLTPPTVVAADAKFSAATAIHPDAVAVITPGLVFPASRIAQLPLELHSAPGVDATKLLAIMRRLTGDMARAGFGILNRQSGQCSHQYAAEQDGGQGDLFSFHG